MSHNSLHADNVRHCSVQIEIIIVFHHFRAEHHFPATAAAAACTAAAAACTGAAEKETKLFIL